MLALTSVVDDGLVGGSNRAKFAKWSHSHTTFAPVVLTRLQPSVDQPPRLSGMAMKKNKQNMAVGRDV